MIFYTTCCLECLFLMFYFLISYPPYVSLSLCLSWYYSQTHIVHTHTHTSTCQVRNTHLLLKYGGNYFLFCTHWSQVLPPNECKWKPLIVAEGEAEGRRLWTAQLALGSWKYDCKYQTELYLNYILSIILNVIFYFIVVILISQYPILASQPTFYRGWQKVG